MKRKIKFADGLAETVIEGIGTVRRDQVIEVEERLAEELVARGTWQPVGWKLPKDPVDLLIERGFLTERSRPKKDAPEAPAPAAGKGKE